jgi:hypothetical protein
MSSPRYSRISGTHYTISWAQYFREETRKWYARLEKATAGGNLVIKIYDDEAAATTGTAAYTASGTVVGPIASTTLTVPLIDNAGVLPVFTGTSLVVVLDAVTSTGTEVWKIDLGKKLERAVLRVLRALSAISIDNGYFMNPVIERGMRQWEEVAVYPWIGVVGVSIASSQPQEIGGGSPWGAGLDTEYIVRILAHDAPAAEPTALFLFQDVRRAIAASQVPYDGPVNDGIPFSGVRFQGIENDLAATWARERSTVEINLVLTLNESASEITTG